MKPMGTLRMGDLTMNSFALPQQPQYSLNWAKQAAKKATRKAARASKIGTLGAAIAMGSFVPAFSLASFIADVATISLGHVQGLGLAAAQLCVAYCFMSVPALLYIAVRKDLKTLVAAGAVTAVILGTLFGLSFN